MFNQLRNSAARVEQSVTAASAELSAARSQLAPVVSAALVAFVAVAVVAVTALFLSAAAITGSANRG